MAGSFQLRWGDTDLRSRLESAARANHRSLHGEIMDRLERSFGVPWVDYKPVPPVVAPVEPNPNQPRASSVDPDTARALEQAGAKPFRTDFKK